MPAFQTVLFDLDGTLLDTLPDLTDSVNYALALNHLPLRTLAEIRTFVGSGITRLMQQAIPQDTSPALGAKCLADFRAHYLLNMENKTAPYPGILPLLDRLQAAGVKLGVVSNKFDSAAKGLVHAYFGDRISVAIGEAPGAGRKPAPDGVYRALEELSASPDGACYIGDSEVDVQTAQNAGLPLLAVSWGFRDAAALTQAGATEIFASADQLTHRLLP